MHSPAHEASHARVKEVPCTVGMPEKDTPQLSHKYLLEAHIWDLMPIKMQDTRQAFPEYIGFRIYKPGMKCMNIRIFRQEPGVFIWSS